MALFFAIIINGGMYFFSDRIVLRIYNAQPLDRHAYASVYDTVHNLCDSMHIPMPKLWLISTPLANAFATGRNPKNGSIAVTTGILSLLSARELRGVLAHELAHIKNRDILLTTIAAVFASAISSIARMVRYASLFASRKRESNNPLSLLLVTFIVPIASTLLQLALSRSREYAADYTGAMLSHDPLALACALEKLDAHGKNAHYQKDDLYHASTAPLFIVNPLCGQGITSLFSTHPPMAKRIERLHQMHTTHLQQ